MSSNLDSVLSSEIEESAVKKNDERISKLSREVEKMVDKIVKGICRDLDQYMEIIDSRLCDTKNKVLDEELEYFIMNLASILYIVSESRERLKIREDVSQAVYKDAYSKARRDSSGTVADKDTEAILGSQVEAVSVIVLQRSSSMLKVKQEAAYEMLTSLKKVLSKRIADTDLSRGGV